MNFTRAAEKLRVAQPSLSRQIQDLEDELGVRLLDRDKVRVSLTDEGRGFLTDAKRLLDQSLESIRSVRSLSKGESGRLNLGYTFKFNYVPLPATLASCYSDMPEISVSLFDLTPADQIHALEERRIDLGFVGLRPPEKSKNGANLNWECIARHDIVVVLPSDHPLTKKKEVFMLDLKPEFFVAMSEDTHPGSHDWLRDLCREAGFKPKVLQHVGLDSGIMDFIREGLGVTVAREHIKRLPQRGIVFRPLANAGKAEFWIAWHRDNASKALAHYMRIVREAVAVLH
ncbi:MAG: LysR family transcriptional regulator [Opitutales bacterium]|nr:LysR family transcriptional regulator [Opitutales bacterium]